MARPTQRVNDLSGSTGEDRARDFGDDALELKVLRREHGKSRVDELREKREDHCTADQTGGDGDRHDGKRRESGIARQQIAGAAEPRKEGGDGTAVERRRVTVAVRAMTVEPR